MNRATPAALAPARRWSVPWVRSRFVAANSASNRLKSFAPLSPLIWWITTSGSDRNTASLTASSRKPSMTTGSAPTPRSQPTRSADRVVATTS
jgi:hypothetical protein